MGKFPSKKDQAQTKNQTTPPKKVFNNLGYLRFFVL